jgi:large subunit ribosomal protein L14
MLHVADNTGAKKLQCIRVLGGYQKRYAGLGDIVTCVVKVCDPRGAVKKSDVVHAVLTRVHKETRRADGTYVRFSDNAAVIINKDSKEPRTALQGLRQDHLPGPRGRLTPMNKLHIKTGDTVKVLAGADKGKTGKVIQAFPRLGRVVVEGVKLTKRHLKTKKAGTKGQTVEFSMPIDASNVSLVEAGAGKKAA